MSAPHFLRSTAILWLCLAGASGAQEAGEPLAWSDLEAGMEVEVVYTLGGKDKTQSGAIKSVAEDALVLSIKLGKSSGTVSIPRADVKDVRRPGAAGENPGGVPAAPTLVEVAFGDGQVYSAEPGTLIDLVVLRHGKNETIKGCAIEPVVNGKLGYRQGGIRSSVPLTEIVSITPAATAPATPGEAADPESPATPEPEEGTDGENSWPPAVGARVKAVLTSDGSTIAGTVRAATETELTIETSEGAFDLMRSDLKSWRITGATISLHQLACLMRHYGTATIPEWAGNFINLPRARLERDALAAMRLASPLVDVRTMPDLPTSEKKPYAFERERLRKLFGWQRLRYLELSSKELDYFFDQRLIDDEKQVRDVFRELRREKPGKEEVSFGFIGQAINNKLTVLADEIKTMKSSRATQADIDAKSAALDAHKTCSGRLDDYLQRLDVYRKLVAATDEELDALLKTEHDRAFASLRTAYNAPQAGTLRERVAGFDMPNPWTATIDLTAAGEKEVTAQVATLFEQATRVEYDEEEWLFNRKLRELPGMLLPDPGTYSFRSGSSGTDAGYAPFYHLVVFRRPDKSELYRAALVRVEPGLHVRVLYANGRILFGDAEEWVHR